MIDSQDTAQANLQNLRIKVGQRYRHFKGGEYEIVAMALQEDTLLPVVVYRSLSKGLIWVRTVEDFMQVIDRDVYTGPRFMKIAR